MSKLAGGRGSCAIGTQLSLQSAQITKAVKGSLLTDLWRPVNMYRIASSEAGQEAGVLGTVKLPRNVSVYRPPVSTSGHIFPTECGVVWVLICGPDLPAGKRSACRRTLGALWRVANSRLRTTGQHANAPVGGEEAGHAQVRVLPNNYRH